MITFVKAEPVFTARSQYSRQAIPFHVNVTDSIATAYVQHEATLPTHSSAPPKTQLRYLLFRW